MHTRPVLALLVAGLLVAACGNKGGLTLPPRPLPAKPAAATPVEPADAKEKEKATPPADDSSAAAPVPSR